MKSEGQAAIFGAILALLSSGGGYIISTWQHSDNMKFNQKFFLAERKYDVFVTYMKSVNQSWAQFKINCNVEFELRQKGIDAYEEMRLIAPDNVQEKADVLNVYFSKLYEGYIINEQEQLGFNEAFNQLKLSAKNEFIF